MEKLIDFRELDEVYDGKTDRAFDGSHVIKIIYSKENDIQLKLGKRNEWLAKDEIYITAYRGRMTVDSPFGSDYSVFFIRFKSRAEERLLNRHFNIKPSQKMLLDAVVSECEIRKTNPSSEISQLMIKSLFEQFFLTLFRDNIRLERIKRKNKTDDETVKQVIIYLKEQLGREIRFDEIVKKAGLSSTGLKTLFKTYTGMGVISYFNHLKIERAKQLLSEGELNATQIAGILGYESIHYFSRQFKKIEGISPSEYIKQIHSLD